jgi:hypothetical protein
VQGLQLLLGEALELVTISHLARAGKPAQQHLGGTGVGLGLRPQAALDLRIRWGLTLSARCATLGYLREKRLTVRGGATPFGSLFTCVSV